MNSANHIPSDRSGEWDSDHIYSDCDEVDELDDAFLRELMGKPSQPQNIPVPTECPIHTERGTLERQFDVLLHEFARDNDPICNKNDNSDDDKSDAQQKQDDIYDMNVCGLAMAEFVKDHTGMSWSGDDPARGTSGLKALRKMTHVEDMAVEIDGVVHVPLQVDRHQRDREAFTQNREVLKKSVLEALANRPEKETLEKTMADESSESEELGDGEVDSEESEELDYETYHAMTTNTTLNHYQVVTSSSRPRPPRKGTIVTETKQVRDDNKSDIIGNTANTGRQRDELPADRKARKAQVKEQQRRKRVEKKARRTKTS